MQKEAQGAAALAADIGDAARYVHLDVSDPDQRAAAIATTLDQFGTQNVLVNNAGTVNGYPKMGSPLLLQGVPEP
jgi:NAD(P)-dependent dehydrogenase (short-subunit alcohol dehydrogenase family)